MQLNGHKMALSVAINGNHIMEEQCWIFVVLQRRHKGRTLGIDYCYLIYYIVFWTDITDTDR